MAADGEDSLPALFECVVAPEDAPPRAAYLLVDAALDVRVVAPSGEVLLCRALGECEAEVLFRRPQALRLAWQPQPRLALTLAHAHECRRLVALLARRLPPQQLRLDSVLARPPWVPDAFSKECMVCGGRFSLARRRHHCRACGVLVCGACSQGAAALGQLGFEGPQRVCAPCEGRILRARLANLPFLPSLPQGSPNGPRGLFAEALQGEAGADENEAAAAAAAAAALADGAGAAAAAAARGTRSLRSGTVADAEERDVYGFLRPREDDAAGGGGRRRSLQPQAVAERQRRAQLWRRHLLLHDALQPSRALSALVRGGVPPELRASLWFALAGAGERRAWELALRPTLYADLVRRAGELEALAAAASEREDARLFRKFARAVEKDLGRTFPDHASFEREDSRGALLLRRVLLAYAVFNPRVGYCQSMNFICAALLLFLDEERAFFLFATALEQIAAVAPLRPEPVAAAAAAAAPSPSPRATEQPRGSAGRGEEDAAGAPLEPAPSPPATPATPAAAGLLAEAEAPQQQPPPPAPAATPPTPLRSPSASSSVGSFQPASDRVLEWLLRGGADARALPGRRVSRIDGARRAACYHQADLLGVRVDQAVFAELVASELPKINFHFDKLELALQPITINWFLCLMITCLPFATALRLLDCFFLFGSSAVVRGALALLRLNEARILRCQSMEELALCVKKLSVPEEETDNFILLCFDDSRIGSLSRQRFEELQQLHLARLARAPHRRAASATPVLFPAADEKEQQHQPPPPLALERVSPRQLLRSPPRAEAAAASASASPPRRASLSE